MKSDGERLLEIRSLKTEFSAPGGIVSAVRGVDLHADRGEFLGIVGESGCGKSVTMLSALRLLEDNARVTAGALTFRGVDLMSLSARAMRGMLGPEIGMIFQDPMTSLDPLYTVGNQLMEPLLLHGKMSRAEARKKAAGLLGLVGISSPEQRLKQYPHEFSGGMRQRVMIAIALSCDPSLLIADEPTTALDVTIQAQVLELMKDMQAESGAAVILITHDLGVIASVCSRVVVMYGGLVMEEALVDDIFYRPAHPYTIGLLSSSSSTEGADRKKLTPIPGSPPDLMNPPAGCPFAARCEYAMRICASARPAPRDLGGGHRAACWLFHKRASAMRARVKHP